jgi:hypothetical protein
MSTGLDIQFVRETYAKMTDQELIRVLTEDASGLTPEAQAVVKEEIKKRKLDPNISKGVDAQQKTYTIAEIDAYCELLRDLPCPMTGSTDEKLNATLTGETISYIFMTTYKKKIVVGSPGALDKANNTALAKSFFLGWWGIPWGIVRTIQAIVLNLKNKSTNHSDEPNKFLRSFVLSKIGQIETYKNNPDKLQEIISGR